MSPRRKFLWSSATHTFQRIICVRNRFAEQEGQNSENKCQMSIDDFSI